VKLGRRVLRLRRGPTMTSQAIAMQAEIPPRGIVRFGRMSGE
jgi:hypothetical protein